MFYLIYMNFFNIIKLSLFAKISKLRYLKVDYGFYVEK